MQQLSGFPSHFNLQKEQNGIFSVLLFFSYFMEQLVENKTQHSADPTVADHIADIGSIIGATDKISGREQQGEGTQGDQV